MVGNGIAWMPVPPQMGDFKYCLKPQEGRTGGENAKLINQEGEKEGGKGQEAENLHSVN